MLMVSHISQIPEESFTFYIELLSAATDARLIEDSTIAEVTIAPSDYVRGLIQFAHNYRSVTFFLSFSFKKRFPQI